MERGRGGETTVSRIKDITICWKNAATLSTVFKSRLKNKLTRRGGKAEFVGELPST